MKTRSSAGLVIVLIALGAVVLGVYALREPAATAGPVPHADAQATEAQPAALATLEAEHAATAPVQVRDAPVPAVRTELPVVDVARSMHGIVVDAETGEPLPHLSLHFDGEFGQSEDVTADASGRFVLENMPAVGRMLVYPLDAPKSQRRTDRVMLTAPEPGTELRVPVVAWPTIRFDVIPEWVARATRLEALAGAWGPLPIPVHDADAPWIRLTPLYAPLDNKVAITVRSVDGLWRGTTAPVDLSKPLTEPVPVELAAHAVLEGLVRDEVGVGIPNAALWLGALDSDLNKRVGGRTDADGRFRLAYLAGGPGTLRVWALRHLAQDVAVDIVPQVANQLTIELASAPTIGSIRGTITSAKTEDSKPSQITLSARHGGWLSSASTSALLWRKSGDRSIAEFEFLNLPDSVYSLTLNLPSHFEIDGLPYVDGLQAVHPGDEAVSLTIVDARSGLSSR